MSGNDLYTRHILFRAVASMRRTSVKFYQILSIFIFFIRLIILEDFIRLISYNGPCVRLGCSFFLATALLLISYHFFHTQEQFCSSYKLILSSSIYCLNLFTYSDCCCVKWGGLKPHVEWVNVPVCYRPCEYFPAVCTAALIYSVHCKL